MPNFFRLRARELFNKASGSHEYSCTSKPVIAICDLIEVYESPNTILTLHSHPPALDLTAPEVDTQILPFRAATDAHFSIALLRWLLSA